jgi:hypothetical protein
MAARKRAKRMPDAAALQMLKTSGMLNRNVTLDQLMKLSAKLKVPGAAARGFIFGHFLYRDC